MAISVVAAAVVAKAKAAFAATAASAVFPIRRRRVLNFLFLYLSFESMTFVQL